MPAPLNLVGQVFSRLTVLRKGDPKTTPAGKSKVTWICLCECGSTTMVETAKLRNGHTSSCGCLRKEIISKPKTHGLRCGGERSKAYRAWCSMRGRCENIRNHKYNLYGGRGISVCERWSKYENFLSDMGNPPTKNHSIDRINVNGNYTKENCRWATASEQSNNLRTTRHFEIDGNSKTITEWALTLGCSRDAIKLRLKRGQSFEFIHSVFTKT